MFYMYIHCVFLFIIPVCMAIGNSSFTPEKKLLLLLLLYMCNEARGMPFKYTIEVRRGSQLVWMLCHHLPAIIACLIKTI